jgi:hypothetical protein
MRAAARRYKIDDLGAIRTHSDPVHKKGLACWKFVLDLFFSFGNLPQ